MKLSRGEKFLEARKIHNRNGKQTQKEVYGATGIPASKIKDLEDDDKNRGVDYREIIKLAKYYGVSLDYLIGDSDDPRPEPGQQAAASYLGISDFEARKLRNLLRPVIYREIFQTLLISGKLTEIIRKISGTRSELKRIGKTIDDTSRNEARHIQRDLADDMTDALLSITGYNELQMQIKAFEQQREQDDYYLPEPQIKEAQHGEHTES